MSILIAILGVAFIEAILSIDNAAIIGSMASRMHNEPLEKKGLGRFMPLSWRLEPRKTAIRLCIFSSFGSRGLLLIITIWMSRQPIAYIAAACYLLLLTWNHFVGDVAGKRKLAFNPIHAVSDVLKLKPALKGFWTSVIAIAIANLAFSIDNAVAVTGYNSIFWMVFLGIFIGKTFTRYAAYGFMQFMHRQPALIHGVFVLIGFIGFKMILAKAIGFEITVFFQLGISLGIMTVAFLLGRAFMARKTQLVPEFSEA